jgi:phosphoribosylglycinamide formyltransferase-1
MPRLHSNAITRIGILISGRGSNMVAIADGIAKGEIAGAEIVLVISDQPEAAGLRMAAARGLLTCAIARGERSRSEHDAEIVAKLRAHEVDLVCLAGYMRVLSQEFVSAYRLRILNIHPSLLPAFPGLAAQQQALEHGVKWTGCTVHFVDESLDGGPIIAQAIVPVMDDDNEARLAARILEHEHSLYPEALNLVVSGNYKVVGRRVLRKNQPVD